MLRRCATATLVQAFPRVGRLPGTTTAASSSWFIRRLTDQAGPDQFATNIEQPKAGRVSKARDKHRDVRTGANRRQEPPEPQAMKPKELSDSFDPSHAQTSSCSPVRPAASTDASSVSNTLHAKAPKGSFYGDYGTYRDCSLVMPDHLAALVDSLPIFGTPSGNLDGPTPSDAGSTPSDTAPTAVELTPGWAVAAAESYFRKSD
eukprot:TRINITY_DN2431_c0_g1_i1.p1 TRINITY_DN2431_c0_g1~~TRINITY_DN2431_c0_g1_i1.p1  ORF type:complete len:204 (-),score=25.04 TRINITY_DN2431_c0_g1_i1:7-618(-)